MSCRDFVEALDDFLCAEASPECLEALDGHLAGCTVCTAYTDTYMQAVHLGRWSLLWDRP